MIFSKRFEKFIFFKCRTIGTCGIFIGPEWAERVYNAKNRARQAINRLARRTQ